VLWREGLPAYPPPAFMWEDRNYLLKMTGDLDFLAEAETLIDALSVPKDKVGGVGVRVGLGVVVRGQPGYMRHGVETCPLSDYNRLLGGAVLQLVGNPLMLSESLNGLEAHLDEQTSHDSNTR
jgi:hypothetical protein